MWDTPPRQGTRGRFPQPRRYPPPALCYAVVVKARAHGRVVHVTTRLVYGTTEQVETALQIVLEAGKSPTFATVRDLVQVPIIHQVPAIEVPPLDLSAYDQLIPSRRSYV